MSHLNLKIVLNDINEFIHMNYHDSLPAIHRRPKLYYTS